MELCRVPENIRKSKFGYARLEYEKNISGDRGTFDESFYFLYGFISVSRRHLTERFVLCCEARIHLEFGLTNFIYSVKLHASTFADLFIQQELIRHFDNVSDEIKEIRDSEEVLDMLPKLEEVLMVELDG